MRLDRVTFTGADDSIDPAELVKISEKYPFVEWGILFGRAQGRSRFPSEKWLLELRKVRPLTMQLSAHLCGQWVQDLVFGADFSWADRYSNLVPIFQRAQVNFHGRYHQTNFVFVNLLSLWNERIKFILQCDGVNDSTVLRLAQAGWCVPLFDTSGGAGIIPKKGRPKAWKGIYCGYAGGLGPENVAEQIFKIEEAAGKERFWIDMERLIRSEDDQTFDLEKVCGVLEQVYESVCNDTGSPEDFDHNDYGVR